MKIVSGTAGLLLPILISDLVSGYAPVFVGYGKPLEEPDWAKTGGSSPQAAPVTPVTNSAVSSPTITTSAAPIAAEKPNNDSPPSSPTITTSAAPIAAEKPKDNGSPPSSTQPTFKPGKPVEAVPINPTPAPAGGCAAVGEGVMTWRISNNYGIPLSVSYLNNADSPSAIGCPGAAQLAPSATTEVVFPTGWAGRIFVGKEARAGDTLIEGSTTGMKDIDVSYVDGYSVPVTCGTEKEVLTGCNIDLWKTGTACTDIEGDNSICRNPTVGLANGPATAFFQPCQGAAYTFPNDNVANCGNTGSELVTCCIGSEVQGCKAPTRQGKGNNRPSKREVFGVQKPAAGPHKHAKRHIGRARNHVRALKF